MGKPKCGNCKLWQENHCINPLSIYGGEEMSPEAEPCMEWTRTEEGDFNEETGNR